MTNSILNSIKHKDRLYKKWKKNNNPENDLIFKDRFKNYEEILKTVLRSAKSNYYFNEFSNCKNDMKKTWAHISQIIKKN